MQTKAPRITTTHDWISVDFGNGRRLTASRSGEKATGAVPQEVFRQWSGMIRATGGGTFEEKIARFVENIDTIWPAWNVAPKAFSVGDSVRYDFGPRRGGICEGKVVRVLRTNYTVDFGVHGLIRMAGDLLADFN
jgi:hypothetical protein